MRVRHENTLSMLKLKKVNTLVLLPDSQKAMLKSIEDFIAWGELSKELE